MFRTVLYADQYKTRFENELTTEISQWIINPYGEIEEAYIILQELV